jgi:predicted DNA-binding protein YlxM (UPF0122 family)
MRDKTAEAIDKLTPTGFEHPAMTIDQMAALRAAKYSYEQIAQAAGISKQAVWAKLNRMDNEVEDAEQFKGHESKILNVLRMRIINHLTVDDIKKMSPRDRVLAYGILYDKHRLETNQSTNNVQALNMFCQVSDDEFRSKVSGKTHGSREGKQE